MAAGDRQDEDLVRDLLGVLREDTSEPPTELPDRAIRKVQDTLTGRDLIDLTTWVFLMRFCAPLLDLVAAFFGAEVAVRNDRRIDDD